MKKINLNEADLLRIVKRVLNEQEDKEFNEDEINVLHLIFERELKPPFMKGKQYKTGDYPYYNRDGEYIGWVNSRRKKFVVKFDPFWNNIKYKVCQVFGFTYYTSDWWNAIKPHMKSWMEDQLNIELDNLGANIGAK